MMDQARCPTSSLDCHGECRDGQFGQACDPHRPADHFAGAQVEEHRHVEPALAGGDIRDIGQPDLIEPGRQRSSAGFLPLVR